MAEEFISQDQHRADLLQLRGELKEEIAGIRQDVAVLSKNVEHLALQVSDLKTDVARQFGEQRQGMNDSQPAYPQHRRPASNVGLGWCRRARLWSGVVKVIFFLRPRHGLPNGRRAQRRSGRAC